MPRNALIPTVPLLGIYLGGLLGGSAVVETLFNYPGLGALLVVAAERKDAMLLTDGVMVTGVIALLALLLDRRVPDPRWTRASASRTRRADGLLVPAAGGAVTAQSAIAAAAADHGWRALGAGQERRPPQPGGPAARGARCCAARRS